MSVMLSEKQAVLAQYHVDINRGFLPPEDPLLEPPHELQEWNNIAAQLPKLLVATCVREVVDKMPVISLANLKDKYKLERAMLAFSFIGHAYVWQDANPPKSLPKSLSIPWCQVASLLGRPPVLSYASYALHNWQRINKQRPIEVGNIALIQNFLGGLDEEWFVVIHVEIEAKAAPAMVAILTAQEAVKNKDAKALEKELSIIETSLASMYETLLKMTDKCDPYIYYNRVRPYIHGWKDHPLFPDGLLYTGAEMYQQPQMFRGETGAQSSIMPALDAALGVVHEVDRMRLYLDEMRQYMPPEHRSFIEAIEKGPSVRDFVLQAASNKSLRDIYNNCVNWVEQFRSKHLEYARDYIFKQHQIGATNPYAVGTGGTPFMPYLEKHRNETGKHLIK